MYKTYIINLNFYFIPLNIPLVLIFHTSHFLPLLFSIDDDPLISFKK